MWLRRAVIPALACLLLLHLLLAWLGSAQTIDDAFISFRYARNLAEGHGLVFNPGERVEGYTNFLWVLLLTAVQPLGDPLPAAKILGVLADGLLLLLFWRFLGRHAPTWQWPGLLLLATHPLLLAHATRGLETSLFALLAWATFQLAAETGGNLRRAAWAGGVGALCILTRPDGLIPVAAAGLLLLLEERSRRWRLTGTFALTAALLLGPYLLWKLAYFGELLPNTYHAKSGGGAFTVWRGLAYLLHTWDWTATVLVGLALLGLVRRAGRDRLLLGALAALLLQLAYVIKVGGDSLGPGRFLVPVTAHLIFGAARGGQELLRRSESAGERAGARPLILGLILAAVLAGQGRDLAPRLRHPRPYRGAAEAVHPHARLGRCLARTLPPGSLVAAPLIGRVGWYSRQPILDPYGLVNRHIARHGRIGAGAAGHSKTDPDYILERRPEIILTGGGHDLAAAPPNMPDWLRRLRQRVSGDPPQLRPPLPAQPIPGYRRVTLDCGQRSPQVWRRSEPSYPAGP